jgi:hypothetical protein
MLGKFFQTWIIDNCIFCINSSIGMAKAALEAMNGLDLYGDNGCSWSVVYVDIDAHNRNRTTFETLLPRESSSKNIDASVITVTGFPAFAGLKKKLIQHYNTMLI